MNILISGITCSGKTTLSNEISSSVIHEDNYYKNLCDLPHNNRYLLLDDIDAFHYDELTNDFDSLIRYGYCKMPNYDFNHMRRINKDSILYRGDINVVEGLHAIELLKDYKDTIKIFMNTDIEECLRRKIKRDKQFGMSDTDTINYFNSVTLKYIDYIKRQMSISDYIIESEEDKRCLLRKLAKY